MQSQITSNQAFNISFRYGKRKIESYINLFKYAQQFYGQKVPDEFSFSMFYSTPPYADLIFQVELILTHGVTSCTLVVPQKVF